MTLRQASNQIRKSLNPYPCKVKARTVSFEGFGFGSAGFIEIECDEQLPTQALKVLEGIKPNLQSQENKFIVSLKGKAYPFGQKI
jgi:hypothetical protein